MATIFNTVERVTGSDQPRFVAKIELVWDTTLASVAKVESTDRLIHGPFQTVADNDGYWEMDDVYPNDQIAPTGSVYRVTEIFEDGTSQGFYIEVPDNATPTFWVGDCLVAEPGYLS